MAERLGIFVLLSLCVYLSLPYKTESRSFTVDYENDVFLKDGKPFRYISGGIDFFRVRRFYWKDRLQKIKFFGVNAIQTYVAWNLHEPEEGQFNFEGENDLIEFIKMADALGLLVILRPGPYICDDWDMGGIPSWLIKNTSIKLRTFEDKRYLNAVDNYMGVLLPKIRPLLYNNGGPIISVQVENEYGYFACEHVYMAHLENLFRRHLGEEVLLFTNNGYSSIRVLECGTLPSLFSTLDFGTGVDPSIPFDLQRKIQPHGPLVNSEFYIGWIDHWGENHQTVKAGRAAKYLEMLLAMNASVTITRLEGGTSFGYMSGSNTLSNASQYLPQPSSYDFDSVLNEAGDTTQKYFLLLEVIASYNGPPSGVLPPSTPKYAYGRVNMTKIARLLDVVHILSPMGPVEAIFPITMEQLGQKYGFLLYETQIPAKFSQSTVTITMNPGVRDRAIIYVGGIRQATLMRTPHNPTASLTVGSSLKLSILIENMGRVNHGPYLMDPKGIIGNVTINDEILVNWQMYPLNLTNILGYPGNHFRKGLSSDSDTPNAPALFMGDIPPASDGIPKDTFLNVKNWHKGQVFINDFNLGRYWPAVGPDETMYVPASILHPGQQPNKIMLLEVDENPCDYPETCFVTFDTKPILNGPVKPLTKQRSQIHKHPDPWMSKYNIGNSSWNMGNGME